MRHTLTVTAATAALDLGSAARVGPATATPDAEGTATGSYA